MSNNKLDKHEKTEKQEPTERELKTYNKWEDVPSNLTTTPTLREMGLKPKDNRKPAKRNKMDTDSRMYREFKANVSAFFGCRNDCTYCRDTFQKQAKRRPCTKCKTFEPHEHPERLEKKPYRKFMRLCGVGDISFASDDYLNKVIEYATAYPKIEFLVQSKNPSVFLKHEWPDNVILCTTLECDGSLVDYSKISKAEPPEKRIYVMRQLHHRKAITIEPILDFDEKIFPVLIQEIKPEWVWIGYDSRHKKHHLPEPSLEKTLGLIKILEDAEILVRKKLIYRNQWGFICSKGSQDGNPSRIEPESSKIIESADESLLQ